MDVVPGIIRFPFSFFFFLPQAIEMVVQQFNETVTAD